MTPKPPHPVLVIGPEPPGALLSILSSYPAIGKVYRAMHPYQVESFLRNYRVDIIFVGVRDWNVRLFDCLSQLENIPRLVMIRGRLDKIDTSLLDANDLFIKEPFTGIQLRSICASIDQKISVKQLTAQYDTTWLMVDRKWRRINCSTIELLQKHPQGQVLVCTTETDWMANSSLAAFLQRLPQDRFRRISDQLVIPVDKINRINKTKGYPFRNGWLPIINRITKADHQTTDLSLYE